MKFKIFTAAAVLALSASATVAQDATPIPLVLAPSGSGMFATSFERTVTGLFIDTFTFTPSAFSGELSVSLEPLAGPINFFSALINGEGFSFLPENGQTTFAFNSMVSADQPLELVVFGYAGDPETLTDMTASYRGVVTAQAVTAIPEPQTYALMLAGLFMVGAAGHRWRRRDPAVH